MSSEETIEKDLDNYNNGSNPSLHLGTRLWRGVTLQLFLVAILPLTILVLVVTFGSLRLHHDAMRSLVADRNLRAVQSAAASLTKEIEHRGEILQVIAKQLTPGPELPENLLRLEADLSSFEGGVAVLGFNQPAVFLGDQGVQELVTSPGWQQLETVLKAANAGEAVYLPLQEIGGEFFIPVGVAVRDGFLLGLFQPGKLLEDGLATISRGETVTIIVVDQEYTILYSKGKIDTGTTLFNHPGIQSALAGSGEINYLPTSSGEHVITTSSIKPVGWALMIEESWEDIASPLLRLTQNAPLIIIPILVVALLALWFGLRQIVQPMQSLESKASELARGNFDAIRQPVGGVPEIGHLQNSLVYMAAQLKEAQASLHSYIGAITDSVENERRSLARELHDDTLQSLIALSQYTQYALHWNKDPKVEKTLNQILDLTEQGMKNLRRLVRGLRPIYIEDLGLATALSMQADNQDRPERFQIHFQQEGEERRLKPEVELALYRMAQEALSNIQRHADARNAWISLYFPPDGVALEIRDDGKGFDVPPDPIHFARQGHYGLLSLYERAEIIGARLTIRSAAGEGTLIRVRLTDGTTPAAVAEN